MTAEEALEAIRNEVEVLPASAHFVARSAVEVVTALERIYALTLCGQFGGPDPVDAATGGGRR